MDDNMPRNFLLRRMHTQDITEIDRDKEANDLCEGNQKPNKAKAKQVYVNNTEKPGRDKTCIRGHA